MVGSRTILSIPQIVFQYSLCRVVLMVDKQPQVKPRAASLSVLALSSRFDGLPAAYSFASSHRSFSTRSVESF